MSCMGLSSELTATIPIRRTTCLLANTRWLVVTVRRGSARGWRGGRVTRSSVLCFKFARPSYNPSLTSRMQLPAGRCRCCFRISVG